MRRTTAEQLKAEKDKRDEFHGFEDGWHDEVRDLSPPMNLSLFSPAFRAGYRKGRRNALPYVKQRQIRRNK